MSELSKSAAALLGAVPQLQGSFIDRVSYSAMGTRDCLDIWLIKSGGLGEAVLSVEGVRYLSIEKAHDFEQSFIDEVHISLLPQEGDWPVGARDLVSRFDGLSELVWIRLVGPAEIEIVCQILTVVNKS
jgi:hypothetical protein